MFVLISVLWEAAVLIRKGVWFFGWQMLWHKISFSSHFKIYFYILQPKKREILSHKNAAMLHIFIHSICIYRLPKCAKLSLKIKSCNILKNAAVKWIFNHIVKILLQKYYYCWESETWSNRHQNMSPSSDTYWFSDIISATLSLNLVLEKWKK